MVAVVTQLAKERQGPMIRYQVLLGIPSPDIRRRMRGATSPRFGTILAAIAPRLLNKILTHSLLEGCSSAAFGDWYSHGTRCDAWQSGPEVAWEF